MTTGGRNRNPASIFMKLKAGGGHANGGASLAYGNDLEQIEEYRLKTGNN